VVSREGAGRDVAGIMWATAAVVAMYAITMFAVTAGVLLGGSESGFFSGHMTATICWIALAAMVFPVCCQAFAGAAVAAHRCGNGAG
jgi:ABC-type dipeptide/oligopeptide/nickel transport system permease subunit